MASCDTTDDYFSGNNNTPILLVKGPFDTEYSVKQTDSMKISQGIYKLDFKISDEEKIDLSVETDPLYNHEFIEGMDRVVFGTDKTGVGTITVYARDSWGKTARVNIALTCFSNIKPVSSLAVSPIEGQTREILIDASASFDADQKYGGKISLYRFFVNGREIDKTYHSKINFTYPKTGEYEIGVQVMDNDNEWSPITYKTIKL
jgi:hypothetical protein